ncbi:MAG: exodeoxyribonuclease VII large subunit, partial [Rhodospirillales bacterium]|nr:exodeoxyribonuclease VII large subunit [Rhodospirillales bacterium]
HDLDRAGLKLEGLSFQRVLDRGFTLVTDDQGQPVLSADATEPGMVIDIRFKDGDIGAVVSEGGAAKPQKKKTAKKSSRKLDDDAQGSLL